MARHFFELVVRSCTWFYLVLFLTIASSALAADSIRVSYATLSAAYMDHICGMDKGYFREEGLNIEVIRAPATVYAHGLPGGDTDWNINSSEI